MRWSSWNLWPCRARICNMRKTKNGALNFIYYQVTDFTSFYCAKETCLIWEICIWRPSNKSKNQIEQETRTFNDFISFHYLEKQLHQRVNQFAYIKNQRAAELLHRKWESVGEERRREIVDMTPHFPTVERGGRKGPCRIMDNSFQNLLKL